ncbi:acyl-[acyl-carrier-protein]--UDP-N-acetylglucosamine O-acyltransferase [Verrucomicrobium sp. GAS474]|uniref:acyl-ACP--UDP-N-acetylglucosamine O-acyltransferase n=1 Tax=Verrucomicrobium sp. GAS474 TaxID=1882831 RepID=UPI00087BAC04|nr:acyl-ACP--UDP-N-acetylglucosamine O-acyltransferase [Verrucomicrobium sp. GAS474]SDU14792.1 acyl-[acyl-carrier-protein]--UDP-N-acetylglucosamine O-acyltransferase [Verrucomicrobium sp. GAS474]
MPSPLIHPTASISPHAQLGNNVRVGPGAQIDDSCVVGDDCEIRAHAVITGGAVLGKGNQIGYGAIIGAEPQDTAFKNEPSRVVIGDKNIIREYVTIHRGTKDGTETRLGDGNFLMVGAHVAHNCHIGSQVIIVNNVLLGGYVEVEDKAFLGGGAVVHQFVRIGELAIIRGRSALGKDLPPYFMGCEVNEVSGLNRIGMRRAGLGQDVRLNLTRAYKFLYRSGMNISQALEAIQKELHGGEIEKLVTFIQNSQRGICRARKASGTNGGGGAGGHGDGDGD